jgi:hypothetical protein
MAGERGPGKALPQIETPHDFLEIKSATSIAQRAGTKRIHHAAVQIGGKMSEYAWPLMFDAEGITQFTIKSGMSPFATRFLHIGKTLIQKDIPPIPETKDKKPSTVPLIGINTRRFTAVMDYLAASSVADVIDERIGKLENATQSRHIHAKITDPIVILQYPPGIYKQVISEGIQSGTTAFIDRIRQLFQQQKERTDVQLEERITVVDAGTTDSEEYEQLTQQSERLHSGLTTLVRDQGIGVVLPVLAEFQKIMLTKNSEDRLKALKAIDKLDIAKLQAFLITPDIAIVIGNTSADKIAEISLYSEPRGITAWELAHEPDLQQIPHTGLPAIVLERLPDSDIQAVYIAENLEGNETSDMSAVVSTVKQALGSKHIPVVRFTRENSPE